MKIEQNPLFLEGINDLTKEKEVQVWIRIEIKKYAELDTEMKIKFIISQNPNYNPLEFGFVTIDGCFYDALNNIAKNLNINTKEDAFKAVSILLMQFSNTSDPKYSAWMKNVKRTINKIKERKEQLYAWKSNRSR